jgi:hypothetical protein
MKIWDVHVHFPRSWDQPEEDPGPRVDYLAEKLREAGVLRACLLCSVREGFTHEAALAHALRHSDLFVPLATVDPEVTSPERIAELHDMGYRGLKMIGVRRPYDCEDYFPIYEKAEEMDMPILFHLGVLGGGLDYTVTHPRRDPELGSHERELIASWKHRVSGRFVIFRHLQKHSIVMSKDVFARQYAVARHAKIVVARGRLEREGEVIHVLVENLERLDLPRGVALDAPSRDFH